ncbi:ABC transporter permease [Chitinophaga polysaccharea]|uniref:ABC transporter permease n=1 Tax=Chitinophaga polysaccharea TaxID=1293035 RepID=UPI001156FAED|nr:ABC transporter permease [Chitinophaga polysaccharea]
MLRNYIKIAIRRLIKSKFYTSINILGLTIGLTVGILILLWVQNEISYDRFHEKSRDIYMVTSNTGSGNSKVMSSATFAPLATFAKREIPDVKEAVRVKNNWDFSLFQYKNNKYTEKKKCYVDPSFFTMFSFKMLRGNPDVPFQGDFSVVITAKTAKRYFGDAEPIGNILQTEKNENFVVSGVLEDFPENSSINYDMFFPMSLSAKLSVRSGSAVPIEEDWQNSYYTTFLQLQPAGIVKTVERKLLVNPIKKSQNDGPEPVYRLQRLIDIHLFNTDGSEGQMQTVRLFFIIGIAILLIACINYVNLSTARAMLRAKEISVRKMVGADRSQLFIQFAIETALIFSFSLIAALILTPILMPLYNNISGKNLTFKVSEPSVWGLIGTTGLISFIVSSVYPAMLLSSFEPLKVLKGKLSIGISTAQYRRILVTIQFAVSVALITTTLIIHLQLNYIHRKELGYDKEHVLMFKMMDLLPSAQSFKEELARQRGIQGVSFASDEIVELKSSTPDTDWEGKNLNDGFDIKTLIIDADFLKIFKLSIVKGKGFTNITSDSMHFILNETAVKNAGITNPIGKRFTLFNTEGTIIGVVKDFHFASLKQRIEPMVFSYRPVSREIFIKTTGKDAPFAIASAENLWIKYGSTFPFSYTFLDETYDNLYKSEQRSGRLFSLFAIIAILISCLGLFGLATYTAEVKAKEIGIRKVMGASIISIVELLIMDFIWLIIIAVIIASPLAWYGMNQWLRNFAYSIEIKWWIFALVGILVTLFALLTVSFQSIKAALMNPIRSLTRE